MNTELTDEEIKLNFKNTGDAYGNSWTCKQCGKNQFYEERPVICSHDPEEYEKQMFIGSTVTADLAGALLKELEQ
tara:strand:+ start:333 stop:557 length:225 start_codon:yes stop_codon:yes gene_type:complete